MKKIILSIFLLLSTLCFGKWEKTYVFDKWKEKIEIAVLKKEFENSNSYINIFFTPFYKEFQSNGAIISIVLTGYDTHGISLLKNENEIELKFDNEEEIYKFPCTYEKYTFLDEKGIKIVLKSGYHKKFFKLISNEKENCKIYINSGYNGLLLKLKLESLNEQLEIIKNEVNEKNKI